MKKIVVALVFGILLQPTSQAALCSIDVGGDTATEFRGTGRILNEIIGAGLDQACIPVNFNSLPQGLNGIQIFDGNAGAGGLVGFLDPFGFGAPQNPRFEFSSVGADPMLPYVGQYTNGGVSNLEVVNFAFAAQTGSPSSGQLDFTFEFIVVPVPEPSTYAAGAFALAMLAWSWRSRVKR